LLVDGAVLSGGAVGPEERGEVTKAETLKARIDQLSPPDKLRLAADLLEKNSPEVAHAIAESVVLELGGAIELSKRGAL
jgi:hypothetical protein